MELINNSRLTAKMDVVRNGSTMLFREEKSRNSINLGNADVVLKHPTNKAMYAKLIKNNWYWVNGCSHCDPSQSPYIVCDEHDKCITCKEPRSAQTQAVWGCFNNTWRCAPCQTKLDNAEKQIALKRVAKAVENNGGYDQWEYRLQDNIKCPHCATEYEPDDVPEGEQSCDTCGGSYNVEPEHSISYTTTVIGERLLPDE
ncbi:MULTISPECIES: hypothetical protein [unclassified Pseudoalteromonas]|uniref:hypothetical protein n=1 Tax=unclassified Pseudoalteromonas TaxID=194690 RepID=UPI0015F89EE6|nr:MULTISPECIES: hypothetical protein [unclassified Pseudoalteromonas]MBB1290995.1 hypothetical protein [Pseudoalteromonas sp. SR41-5]MBB1415303.1 hypothetical protein [Pseudoalteromonas sp. SG43-8]